MSPRFFAIFFPRNIELAGSALYAAAGLFGVIFGTLNHRECAENAKAGGPEAAKMLKQSQRSLWRSYLMLTSGLVVFGAIFAFNL
jgi:hypothetical protein